MNEASSNLDNCELSSTIEVETTVSKVSICKVAGTSKEYSPNKNEMEKASSQIYHSERSLIKPLQMN